jgi:hypothetical protein
LDVSVNLSVFAEYLLSCDLQIGPVNPKLLDQLCCAFSDVDETENVKASAPLDGFFKGGTDMLVGEVLLDVDKQRIYDVLWPQIQDGILFFAGRLGIADDELVPDRYRDTILTTVRNHVEHRRQSQWRLRLYTDLRGAVHNDKPLRLTIFGQHSGCERTARCIQSDRRLKRLDLSALTLKAGKQVLTAEGFGGQWPQLCWDNAFG